MSDQNSQKLGIRSEGQKTTRTREGYRSLMRVILLKALLLDTSEDESEVDTSMDINRKRVKEEDE